LRNIRIDREQQCDQGASDKDEVSKHRHFTPDKTRDERETLKRESLKKGHTSAAPAIKLTHG